MNLGGVCRYGVAILALAVLALSPARGEFVLIEDFEGLPLGPIDGQNGWHAEDVTTEVIADPAGGGGQVLAVVTESTHLYKEVLILSGTTRMFFLRFRYANQLNFSLGLTDVSNPSRFDHFEVELSMTNSTSELRINEDGTYAVLTLLDPDTWYNCWMLINNESDETQVWLHPRGGQSATAEDQLDAQGQKVFLFRNGTAANLVNFFIKTGGGSGVDGPLFIDDLYLENTSSFNLDNPSGMPSGIAEGQTSLALNRLYPNPVRDGGTIRFALAEAGEVELAVFDIRGRRVASLVSGSLGAGSHEIPWRGLDLSGEPLPNGMYLYRLRAGDRTVTRKVVVAR